VKRRDLLAASAAFGALSAVHAAAQTQPPRIIVWFSIFTHEAQKSSMQDFSAHLARLGHVQGRDYVIEARFTAGDEAPLAALAREMVGLKPAVIVTGGGAPIAALKEATTTVPIIFYSAPDPVKSGFVASLARPGGNITGVALRGELHAKLFDLVREVLPASKRVALLEDEGNPVAQGFSKILKVRAEAMRYDLQIVPMAGIKDVDRAFATAVKGKAEAMIVPQYSLFLIHAKAIGEQASKARLPTFSTWRNFTLNGGLISYYSDFRDSIARIAALTDQVLRGASPAELPVEQPDRFTLVVNVKAAKALGIKMPQSVLVRADEVIQ
jgi:putative ABC transport system substrate-binding protein